MKSRRGPVPRLLRQERRADILKLRRAYTRALLDAAAPHGLDPDEAGALARHLLHEVSRGDRHEDYDRHPWLRE